MSAAPSVPGPIPQSVLSRRNEQKHLAAGAVRMPGGVLPAEAAAALDALIESGYASTKVGVIARALVEAYSIDRHEKSCSTKNHDSPADSL